MTIFKRLWAGLAGLLLTGAASAFTIPPQKAVLEYFNTFTGHYVLLSDVAEIAGVDAGAAGHGWKRTGYMFSARDEAFYPANVCRFYAPGPNSHFFTLNAQECEFLKTRDTGWYYEKLDFSVEGPTGGVCPANLTPIYRLYNARFPQNDSNHRFIHDASVRDEMVGRGWVDEGVGFCATYATRLPDKSFLVETDGEIRPSAECENEAINLGPCIALNQIPPLTNRIQSWLPPSYVTKDPQFSPAFEQVTGFDGNLYTAQPPGDTTAVAAHSFAQSMLIAKSIIGVHVSYLDRTIGNLASINPLYQFTTTAPVSGSADARVFPWNGNHENNLEISFNLLVKTIRRHSSGSQAYGHPTLQFLDTRSGNHLYVTLATYGTGVPGKPGDLLTIDQGTGRVIVSTAFREDPRFGTRIAGNFLHCDGDANSGGCEQPASDAFRFRIDRGDFQVVLDLARSLNGTLSSDPRDYLLANFHFNNEIHLGGELGARLMSYQLELHQGY
jgi:hypothetical protein